VLYIADSKNPEVEKYKKSRWKACFNWLILMGSNLLG